MAECGCAQPLHYGPYLANNCGASSFVVFMSLVDAIIRNTCDVSDVCGRVHARSRPDDVYDFIVIGGGSGGSAITGRLAEERSWKVLLIEAGPDEPETYQVPGFIMKYGMTPLLDWNYKTTNEPVACQGTNNSCVWPRAKILGGCSVINGMMYTRGTPPDFNVRWSKGGLKGWNYNDVLPYFRKFENNLQYNQYNTTFHGIRGPVTVSNQYYVPDLAYSLIQGAREAGFPISSDLNGVNYTGFAIPQSFIKDGVRVSMAKAYLRPQRNNPRLDVMINSTVTKILISNSSSYNTTSKTAYAVQFVYKNRTYTVKATKEIILAAGTINSPKILLQSGVGPKDALDAVKLKQVHDLPGVGHNMTNHVAFSMQYWINSTVDTNMVTCESLREYLDNRTGPLASAGMPVTARIPSRYGTAQDPDIQLFFTLSVNQCSKDGALNSPVNPADPKQAKSLSISAVVLHPESRGRITLKSSNPFDPPIMIGNYLTAKADEDRLLDGIRLVQKLVNSTTLKNKLKMNYGNTTYGNCSRLYTWDSDKYWICCFRYKTGPENHQASSLKMGSTKDKWSVVDEQLRVIGINNLRVADASAMPVVTSSNTNAPIVMLAERCADFIKQKWKRAPIPRPIPRPFPRPFERCI